jgi:ribosomal-protein-alanine N-acetyltransferase
MLDIQLVQNEDELNKIESKQSIIDFLFTHLEKFGDDKKSIEKCIDYALSDQEGKGGFILTAYYEGKKAGVLIMNKTGMQGYIPENILVYIAVDAAHRGKGFGKQIIEKSFEIADGDVKLHVEYDNPAKRLYERIGFVNKYAEMRYSRK